MTTKLQRRQEALKWAELRPSWWEYMARDTFDSNERKKRRKVAKRAKASRKRNRP